MLDFLIYQRNNDFSDVRIAKCTNIIIREYDESFTELKRFILSTGNQTVRKYDKIYSFVQSCFRFMDNYSNKNGEFFIFFEKEKLKQYIKDAYEIRKSQS